MAPMKLTRKQARFVEEYLADLNAAQAAIRAGYSAKTARVIGHENLTKPDIAAAIEKARAERAERAKLTGDMVVDELRKIGFASRPGLDAAEGLGSADVLKITDPAAVLVGVATAFVADNRRSRSPIALKVC